MARPWEHSAAAPILRRRPTDRPSTKNPPFSRKKDEDESTDTIEKSTMHQRPSPRREQEDSKATLSDELERRDEHDESGELETEGAVDEASRRVETSAVGRIRATEKVDLVAIAGLATWTDQVVSRIGKEHLEPLLEISVIRGRLSKGMKEIILTIARFFEGRDPGSGPSAKEMVSLLAQLDALSGGGTSPDAKILSLPDPIRAGGPPINTSITTMLLTIAGILSAVAVFNAIYPAVTRSSGAVTAASARVDDRLKSGIEIVHAVGELDANDTFQDTNGNGKFDFFVWIKNVGDTTIDSVDDTDLFLGLTGSFNRIPHEGDVQSTVFPRWSSSIENNSVEWATRATLKMTVTYDSPPDPTPAKGTYDVKVIIPNGISAEDFFSM